MTKVIGVIISAIFYFGLNGDIEYRVKKASLTKVQGGLSSLSSFTRKMTN